MKRFTNYLIALALTAFTFTSCEDVPSPFGEIVKPDNGDVVVIDPSGSGTETDPYNVAGVLEYISGLGADVQSSNEVYIKGIISEVQDIDITGTYGNATYYISDDADGKANKFMIYRGFGLGGKKFNEGATAIKAGDNVVIKSKVVNYKGNTPETVSNNCIIVELNGTKDSGSGGGSDTPTPSGDAKGTGTEADPFNIAAAIAKCKEVGETASTEKYYIKGIVVSGGTVSGGYGNVTFKLGDSKDATEVFTAFQVAGSDGEKLADGYEVKAGSTVIVYGPIMNYMGNTPETSGKSAAQIVTIDGKKTNEGGGGGSATGGDGSQNNPFNIAEAIAKCKEVGETASTEKYYIKGIVVTGGTVSGGYGNVTFKLGDSKDATEVFTAFQVAGSDGEKLADGYEVKAGSTVIVYGPIMNYKGNTPETAGKSAAQIVTIDGKKTNEGSGGGGQGGGGETSSTLTNGGFETWADGLPTGWKSASSASSATLEQSSDAHGGSYACIVKGGGSKNVRLASQEITLEAGSYTFAFYVKATSSNKAQVRPGFVPVTDGAVGSYAYGDYKDINTSWSQVSTTFTLDAKTTVCLVVMNPKSGSYSSGEDVIVDDATLTKN